MPWYRVKLTLAISDVDYAFTKAQKLGSKDKTDEGV